MLKETGDILRNDPSSNDKLVRVPPAINIANNYAVSGASCILNKLAIAYINTHMTNFARDANAEMDKISLKQIGFIVNGLALFRLSARAPYQANAL